MYTIPLKKTIRPTQLQPRLYSIINDLGENADYRVILNRSNDPVCVLISYPLLKNVDLESMLPPSKKELEKMIEEYYANVPDEEKEWIESDDFVWD